MPFFPTGELHFRVEFASRNVTIQGSLLDAGGDIAVSALENVTMTTGQEAYLDYSHRSSSGLGGLTGRSQSDTVADVVQVGSMLNSGNDVVVMAGNDVGVAGSVVSANNDVELYAGLINDEGDSGSLSPLNFTYQHTNADNIYDLEGWGAQLQVNVGKGVDYGMGTVYGDGYTGAYGSIGFDLFPVPIPFSVSGDATNTVSIWEIVDNRSDEEKKAQFHD